MQRLQTRSLCVVAAMTLLAGLLLVTGCQTSSQGPATVSPDNPLVPAQTASATAGSANEKAAETQKQLDDLTGGDK